MLNIEISSARGQAQWEAAGLLLRGIRVHAVGEVVEITAITPDGREVAVKTRPLCINEGRDTLMVPLQSEADTTMEIFPKTREYI